MVSSKFLDIVNTGLGEIDFPSSVNIRDSKGFPCKFQFPLISSADDQNHNAPPNAKAAQAHSSPTVRA